MDYLNSLYSVAGQAVNLSMKMGHKVLSSTGIVQNSATEIKLPPSLQNLDVSKLVKNGNPVVRMAALSGACAVILGAYGAHKILALGEKENNDERVTLFETANRYHFYHTFALMCTPLCRHPRISAGLLASGLLLFSGTCYYHAFTGNNHLKNITPVGGILLVMAWLSMVM